MFPEFWLTNVIIQAVTGKRDRLPARLRSPAHTGQNYL